MSGNPKEQFSFEPRPTVGYQSVKDRLMGQHPKRAEQLRLAESAASKFDFRILESLGLTINEEQLSLAPQHLVDQLTSALNEQQAPEIEAAVADAIQQASRTEAVKNFKFPLEKQFGLRLASLLLLFILAGAFIPSRAEASTVLPTVTPTAESTKASLPTVTPTPDTKDDATPTPQATKKAASTPTITPYPTVTNTPTATPEATATAVPEVKTERIETAFTTADTLNVRTGPGTSFEAVTSIPKGTEVRILAKAAGGWVQVSFTVDGKEYGVTDEYYVSSTFLTEPKITVVVIDPETGTPNPVVEGVDTEAVGGDLSEVEIQNRAVEVFGPDATVELNQAGTFPIAKIDQFVVGEFLNGEWQQIREVKVFTEKQIRNYPDLVEEVVDGTALLVQTTFGQKVIIAEKSEKGEWIQPSMTSFELTKLAKTLNIMSRPEVGRDREFFTNYQPYKYDITEHPEIQFDSNGEIIPAPDYRSVIARGVIAGSPQVVHLPIMKEVKNEKIDTGWSVRLIVLPLASVDYQGNWFIHYVVVGATTPLVTPKGEVLGHKFNPDDTIITNDQVSYAPLRSPFSEDMFYNSSFSLIDVSKVITDMVPGTAVGLNIYAASKGGNQAYWDDAFSYLEDLRNGFELQDAPPPTPAEIFAFITLTMFEAKQYSVQDYEIRTDTEIIEFTDNGGKARNRDVYYWGNTAVVRPILNSANQTSP